MNHHEPKYRTITRRVLACACLLGVAGAAYADDTAELRCWYNQPNEATVIATERKVAKGLTLQGRWANLSSTTGANLFYTKQTHAALREACDQAVTLPQSMRDRVPYLEREVLGWHAQSNDQNYNHQIWHVGDQAPGKAVDRIVAFGDSLSDNGNMYNYSLWTLPHGNAWVVGRFSDGPVWVEHLANMLDIPLNNWSIGGSARDTAKGLIDGIEQQLTSFGKYATIDRHYDPSRTLFTFLTGANDIMNDEGNANPGVVDDMLQRHESALRTLATFRAEKVLILNLPDISKTPAFLAKSQDVRDATREKVHAYNKGIAALASRVGKDTGMDLQVFDLASAFDELLNNPSAFDMTSVSTSCLDLPSGLFIDYVDHVKRKDWCEPGEWAFWDGVHPTTALHRRLADWAFDAVAGVWRLEKAK